MIYLSEKATAFLSMLLKVAKDEKDQTLSFGKSSSNLLKLQIISEERAQTKFCIKLADDIFSITYSYQQGMMIPYKYVDREHLPENKLFSIEEIDLTKGMKQVKQFHFVILAFSESIVESLINYLQNPDKYKKEFEENSFRTIRFIFLLFITENSKYRSWGVSYVNLENEAITFKVHGHHFTGLVQIKYNRGTDLFEVNYIDAYLKAKMGGRTGIDVENLIELIDKQIEYVPEYGKN